MKTLLLFAALSLTAGTSFAHDHSTTVCSPTNKNVCAHLGLDKPLNSKEEGVFMAHVMTPNDTLVQNFKLDLWMDMGSGHGHGSSPVDMNDLGKNKFEISNAWFVMPGNWLVRMDFEFEGTHQHLQIPIVIKD